jgi:hypothetical protein
MSVDYKQKYLKYKKKYLDLKEQMGGKTVFRNSVYVDGKEVFHKGNGPEEMFKQLMQQYPNYNKTLTKDEFKFLIYIMFGANYGSANQSYWKAIYDSCTKANNKVSLDLCSNDLEEAKKIIKKVEATAKTQLKKGQRIDTPVYGIADWTPFIPAKVVEIYVDKSKVPPPKKKTFMKKLSGFTKSKKEKEAEKKHKDELAKKATKDATMYRVKVQGTSYWFEDGKEVSFQFNYDDETHPLHELHKTPGQYYNNQNIKPAEPAKDPKVGDIVYVPYTEDWDDGHGHHIYMSQARSNGPNDVFLTFYPTQYSGVLNGFHMKLTDLERNLKNKKRGEGSSSEDEFAEGNVKLSTKDDVQNYFKTNKKIQGAMGCPAFGDAHKECNAAKKKATDEANKNETFSLSDMGKSWFDYNYNKIMNINSDKLKNPAVKLDIGHMVKRLSTFINYINDHHEPDVWKLMRWFDDDYIWKVKRYNESLGYSWSAYKGMPHLNFPSHVTRKQIENA